MRLAEAVAMPLPTRQTAYPLLALWGEAEGFSQIGHLHAFASACPDDTVIVDCGAIRWLDAHLAAGYAAVAGKLKAQANKKIQFVNLLPSVQSILSSHGLFGLRGKSPRSVIPLRSFQPGDAKAFAGYTASYLSKQPIPDMSPKLTEKFFEGIDELFSNAELHSKTMHGIVTCGQFFPRRRKVDFTIVDLGIGFHGALLASLGKILPPHKAIEWGMTGTNTTRSGDIPGGLGLKILKEFVCLNGGRLSVVSHDGHWSLAASRTVSGPMTYAFPGTAVILEINTGDNRSYSMRDEAQEWRQT